MFKRTLALGMAIATALTLGACSAMNQQVMECTVIDKESVARDKGHEYRIYTRDCGTFAVHDSLWIGRWDSADTYGQIRPGNRYEFHTGGYRAPFLSMFPNVIDIQPISE